MFLVMGKDYSILPWLSFIASVSNTLCVILTAKKKVINFAWGVIGVITYGIVAFAYANTGEWMLNFLYYFPTNIIAWVAWYKTSSDKINVESKGMTLKQTIFTVAITIAGVLAYAWFISLPELQIFFYGEVTGFGFYKYLIDSFTTVLSIVSMILLIKCYREQWLLWVAVDAVSIILWIITFEPTMILLWATMLTNAIYGYVKWRKGELKNV
jgi:nicotinamide mononucleotide transporter